MIFDNRCYLCTKFAKIVHRISRGRLECIGHYTKEGISMRQILGESAVEMFWFVKEKQAFGGRAALIPLVRFLASTEPSGSTRFEDHEPQGCKTPGAVFIRSASIITHSRKINI